MKKSLISTLNRLIDTINPSAASKAINRKKTITDFAEKHGLVYFGHVDKSKDEHYMVRGATVSPTHRDSHYCVGTRDGYDMVFLQRKDILRFPGMPDHNVTWLILAIDLHQAADLPHVFVDSRSQAEVFYAKLLMTFSQMRRVNFNILENHSEKFMDSYSVLTSIDRALEAEAILSPDVTKVIGEHFYPLDIEIEGDNLYIYSSGIDVTPGLLDAMMTNGLWLASKVDQNHQKAHNNHIEGSDNLAV